MKTIQMISSAPLKMMIAGEWSVLQPGNHGIVTALNSRVTVTMAHSVADCWSLTTNHGKYLSELRNPLGWKINDPYWKLACTLLKIAGRWYPLTRPYTIHIETPLFGSYGLGSSAAVSAALAAAVISAVSLRTPDKAEILRLALISHTASQGWRGSGCDCAAAVYGGTIAFRSFDIKYLKSAAQDDSTWNLLLHDLGSSVRALPQNPFRAMVPIWTGHKESTPRLLKHSESLFNSPRWEAHFEEGERIALGMATVATLEDAAKYLLLGRNWFYAFNLLTGGRVVPARMRSLLDLLAKRGATAKPSGAGGGDCLVGMLPAELLDETIQKWIVPLSSNAEGVMVKTGD